ncbi:MAG: AtpZ/AtpI family protein [Microthrixaceae bacterium]
MTEHQADPHRRTPSRSAVATEEMTRSLHRSSASFELAFAPVLMALIGLWLDHTFGTLPVFTIVLAVMGTIGAGLTVYYSYGHAMARLRENATRPARARAATIESEGDRS